MLLNTRHTLSLIIFGKLKLVIGEKNDYMRNGTQYCTRSSITDEGELELGRRSPKKRPNSLAVTSVRDLRVNVAPLATERASEQTLAPSAAATASSESTEPELSPPPPSEKRLNTREKEAGEGECSLRAFDGELEVFRALALPAGKPLSDGTLGARQPLK